MGAHKFSSTLSDQHPVPTCIYEKATLALGYSKLILGAYAPGIYKTYFEKLKK
jgi:hypothetical protein